MPVLATVSVCVWYLSLRLYIPLILACRFMKDLDKDENSSALTDMVSSICEDQERGTGDWLQIYQLNELRPCERQLRILQALTAVAPLLGLLGTVKGMITTFIALGSRGMTSMDILSTGISEALITTQVGLVIALPGLVSSHASIRLIKRLKNIFDRIELRLGMFGEKKKQIVLAEV